jgi:hypothetical protein
MDATKLVTLVHFRYAHRAHLMKTHLEDEGIDCNVTEKSVLDATDGVRLQVFQKDVAKALAVIMKVREEFADDIIDEVEGMDEE